MTWQQSFVVLWIQFAVGTASILFLTRLALRWVPQPVERARLICGMLIAVLTLPLLSTLVPLPSWNLALISIHSPSIPTTADMMRRDMLTPIGPEDPVDVNDSTHQATTSVDRTKSEPLQVFDNSSVDSRQSIHPAVATFGRSFIGELDRWFSRINVWTALVIAIILAHVAAASYFVFEYVIGQVRLERLCRLAMHAPESVCQNWKSITRNRGNNVRLLVSNELHVPLMFGWLRPTIVVPSNLAKLADAKLDACLAHEWSHIELCDMLTCYFLNLCQFVLWYQPGFWSLRRELRISQEFVADARSSGGMTCVEYAEFLLEMAKGRRPLLTANALTLFDEPSQLARRIKMLLETQTALIDNCRMRFTWVMLLAATFLAVTISCVRLGSAVAEEPAGAAQEPPPASRKVNAAQPDDAVKAIEPAPAAEPAKADDAEKDVQPKFRSVIYQKTITTKGTQQPAVVKEYLAEDGRKRSEIAGGTVTIFDKSGNIRATLMTQMKSAIVYPAKTEREFKAENYLLPRLAALRPGLAAAAKRTNEFRIGFEQRKFETLKKLCDKPNEKLGQKEIAGKLADGFIVHYTNTPHTVWLDATTGDLVQVEYDSAFLLSSMHIEDSQFQFDEKLDDSLFRAEAPAGYKVHQPLGVTTESSSEKLRQADAPVGMQRTWTRNNGSWKVATNPLERRIYSGNLLGVLMTFDDQGEIQSSFSSGQAKLLRVADLDGDGKCEFVTAGSLGGSTVNAYRLDGELLWTYARDNEPGHDWSVNDLCVIDLNGDGTSEVVIGFNGGTGLRVLDNGGKLLQKDTTVKNVWHVAAGRLEPNDLPNVVCTSVSGKVHLFDGMGKSLRLLDVGFYANMVRVWPASDTEQQLGRIIAAGTVTQAGNENGAAKSKEIIAAFDPQGQRQWSLEIGHRVVSVATCPTRPWLAVSFADGTARVLEALTGKEIARVGGQGEMTDLDWLAVQDAEPVLIIANGTALSAFKISVEKP